MIKVISEEFLSHRLAKLFELQLFCLIFQLLVNLLNLSLPIRKYHENENKKISVI